MKTWPDRNQWKSAASVSVPTLLVIAGLGFLGGWMQWQPVADWQSVWVTILLLFFIPAFFEELIFRGVLLSWLAARWTRWSAWIATLLFVLWHPLQYLTFGPPWSEIFIYPSFLFATLILGIILAHIRMVSRSLWPAIFVHWIAVLAWKLLFGGPY